LSASRVHMQDSGTNLLLVPIIANIGDKEHGSRYHIPTLEILRNITMVMVYQVTLKMYRL